jgi:hypothetical protein
MSHSSCAYLQPAERAQGNAANEQLSVKFREKSSVETMMMMMMMMMVCDDHLRLWMMSS